MIRVARFVACFMTTLGLTVPTAPARTLAWTGYQVIMWQSQTEPAYAALRRMGVTAGRITPGREAWGSAEAARQATPLLAAGLGFYLENIATDFYAPYHRWRPDRPVNALYNETLARWRSDPGDPTVFFRDPSLFDPAWRSRIADRLAGVVGAYASLRPLYYNLGDETGIADLSANWDFDRSPAALRAFRDWLVGRYPNLAALNAAWDTQFRAWADVVPDTTFQVLHRQDGNNASWADFKAWMDESFAAAVRAGADTVHRADPAALAGLEGVQLPGWGGYDYATLAPAVDLMEIYPDPVDLEIAQDFHPGLIVLTTSAPDAAAAPAIWRALLRGARGVVLWDDNGALVRPDGSAGPAAASFGPVLQHVEQMAPEILDSAPIEDPVAILYSQASFRARWLLDQRAGGDAWVERGAEGENADNAWRHAMRAAGTQLLHLGIHPLWVTEADLAHGLRPGTKALLLPQAIALSDDAVAAIKAFAADGGSVIADVPPGSMDDRLRKREPLPGVNIHLSPGLWQSTDAAHQSQLADLLTGAGVKQMAVLENSDGTPVSDTAVFARKFRDTIILLLQRDQDSGHEPVSVNVHLDCFRIAQLTGAHATHSVGERTVALSVSRERPAKVEISFDARGRDAAVPCGGGTVR